MSDVVGRINFGPLSSDPLPVSELDKHHIKLAQCWCDSQTQIADLTKRLAAADKAKDATYLQMVDRIGDLEERLAAAEGDTARLEWMQQGAEVVSYALGGFEVRWDNKKTAEYPTIREAIDAARKEVSNE